MSKFGFEQMKGAGLENAIYIPHGVNTNIYKPQDLKETRAKILTKLPNRDSIFVVGINAANKGERKAIDRELAAFKIFLEANPDAKKDAYIYLNTWLHFPEGYDLEAIVKKLGLGSNVILVHEWKKYCGMNDAEMVDWYNCIDVFLNASQGEGFGLPIIEACACGKPVITTKFSSMPELTEGHGWLVDPSDVHMTYLLSYMALPNVNQIADRIGYAYNHRDECVKLGEKAREFSLEYDYQNKIIPMWTEWFDKVRDSVTASFDKPNIALAPEMRT
jgi:glycosyltransferase involved in cell wall biosynthesis